MTVMEYWWEERSDRSCEGDSVFAGLGLPTHGTDAKESLVFAGLDYPEYRFKVAHRRNVVVRGLCPQPGEIEQPEALMETEQPAVDAPVPAYVHNDHCTQELQQAFENQQQAAVEADCERQYQAGFEHYQRQQQRLQQAAEEA
ncbi:hypothetical protein B0H14DRAFT_3463722 [Mycena olivaceomarginata]|nr:hypothetical protein B0H14DRAFT_3463722 [Mycena olivaceomarginata]